MSTYIFENVRGFAMDYPTVTNFELAKKVAKELALKYRTSVYVSTTNNRYCGCVEYVSWFNSVPGFSVNDLTFNSYR